MKEVFKDMAVNVTVQGQKHLAAVIGSREYLEEYVSEKVTNWVSKVTKLAELLFLSHKHAMLHTPLASSTDGHIF